MFLPHLICLLVFVPSKFLKAENELVNSECYDHNTKKNYQLGEEWNATEICEIFRCEIMELTPPGRKLRVAVGVRKLCAVITERENCFLVPKKPGIFPYCCTINVCVKEHDVEIHFSRNETIDKKMYDLAVTTAIAEISKNKELPQTTLADDLVQARILTVIPKPDISTTNDTNLTNVAPTIANTTLDLEVISTSLPELMAIEKTRPKRIAVLGKPLSVLAFDFENSKRNTPRSQPKRKPEKTPLDTFRDFAAKLFSLPVDTLRFPVMYE